MNREQIKHKVESYIQKSIDGLEIESPKVDFKRQWYNLKDRKGKNEFIKDVSAIANTFGLDGFIIIGFDEKTKGFHSTRFNDSNLRDSSDITNLIASKCSDLFDVNTYDFSINEGSISVIHIPPTLVKPIVVLKHETYAKDGNIKNHPNKIFVRKNTVVKDAAKYDIELMYYDRKNIIPDYELSTTVNDYKFNLSRSSLKSFFVEINLTITNSGRKPVAIKDITGRLILFNGEEIDFGRATKIIRRTKTINFAGNLNSHNSIVKSNDILNDEFDMELDDSKGVLNMFDKSDLKNQIKKIYIQYYLSNGNYINDNIEVKTNLNQALSNP